MVDQVQALLRIDERIADVLHLLNLPSARDLKQMQARLDELAAKLEERAGELPAVDPADHAADTADIAPADDASPGEDAPKGSRRAHVSTGLPAASIPVRPGSHRSSLR